jgi:hypothetical protein
MAKQNTAAPVDTPAAIAWLMGFAYLELDTLTPGQWLDLVAEAKEFGQPATPSVTAGKGPRLNVTGVLYRATLDGKVYADGAPGEMSEERLRLAQGTLRERLQDLVTKRRCVWPLPSIAPRVLEVTPNGTLAERFGGFPDEIFLARAALVLQQHWRGIRTCRRDGCGRMFWPVRRQIYCSRPCSQAVQWSKYVKTNPKRDYRAEYAQRVRRVTGSSVKIRRRARRKR